MQKKTPLHSIPFFKLAKIPFDANDETFMRCMGFFFFKIDIFPLDVFSIYLPFLFFLLRAGVCWERQMRKNVNETEGTGDLWRLPGLLVAHVPAQCSL